MAHESRITGLSAAEADELEREWRQLGATAIRRTPEGNDRFTMEATFPGSPFATDDPADVETAPAQPAAPLPAISSQTAFPRIAAEYLLLFDACRALAERQPQIEAHERKIRQGAMRYGALGERLGIPWFFIGIVHSLECACDFKLHLHNGDPLSGRTRRVPAGRPAAGQPPFTWEHSAEDALRMKGYVDQPDWSVAAMLFRWETFNGMGYRVRGLASPYLWSFSNLYERGLFVEDHVFDPAARSKQCGAAILLKRLQALP